jgi:hypothetical protein
MGAEVADERVSDYELPLEARGNRATERIPERNLRRLDREWITIDAEETALGDFASRPGESGGTMRVAPHRRQARGENAASGDEKRA